MIALQTDWDVVLRDGATLHVRPYDGADADRVRQFLRELSADTRHHRFFGMLPVERFDCTGLDASDPGQRYTLLAEANGRVLALGTYVRARHEAADAEVAFVVADRLQGRGVGTRLLELLAQVAWANDVSSFTAVVLPDNLRMLELFRTSGLPAEFTMERDHCRVTLDLRPPSPLEERSYDRSCQAAAASMHPFFEPRTIAVVGAGRRRGGIGAEVFHNLQAGFAGRVVPVNPQAEAIGGVSAYASVGEIGSDVDLAVIAVPSRAVPAVVDDCLAHGVRALVVITAGFAESGPEGRRIQADLLARIRNAGCRLMGPNCLGLINTDPAVRLNASFAPAAPPPGTIAMATQSGALGLAMLDYVGPLNLGISSFASIGNEADVSSNDLIQYWADDPRTDVILLYLESMGDPRTFGRLARRVSRRKPIVSLKAGRSTAGVRATGSHTGALALPDVLVDGLFKQAGVIRTLTLQEMFDVATLVAGRPLPAGARLGIITNAGGAGILAADTAEGHGLTVAPLGLSTSAALRTFLPSAASVHNPVDMLATAPPADYERTMRHVLADPEIDAVLVAYVPPLVSDPSAVASAIVAGASDAHGKPIAVAFMTAAPPPPQLAGLPCYRFPESAALAMARVAAYCAWRKGPADTPLPVPPVDREAIRATLGRALARGGGWLPVAEVQTLLDACGIATANAVVAASEADAIGAAERLGFPVAIKAIGPDLLHKSEAGGVRLGVADSVAAREAHRDLRSRLGDRMTGALVQRMMPDGAELLVGTVEDETFGPVMLVSLGGTLVELLGKPVARLLPLMDSDVDALLEDLPGRALLDGYHGTPRIDDAALRGLLTRVSWLASAHSEIAEMDLNPVRLYGDGLVVLDARIKVARPSSARPGRRVSY